MAVIQDPTGAVLSLWQPAKHIGVGVNREYGTFCWQELLTNDLKAARAFYTSLFGWATKADETEYTEFILGKDSFAGMMKLRPEWGNVPPHWGVYFLVEKCDATVEKAGSLGGQTCVPPMDIEKVGRFATLQDAQGAAFSVIQLAESFH
jgi:predicted enzyme related to lactoylglutathione lyase